MSWLLSDWVWWLFPLSLFLAVSRRQLSQPENTQKLEAVESAADGARKQVRSQIQTIDGSMSLEKLAQQMRNMDVCKLRGNDESSIMIVYIFALQGSMRRMQGGARHPWDVISWRRSSRQSCRHEGLYLISSRTRSCTRFNHQPTINKITINQSLYTPLWASTVNH